MANPNFGAFNRPGAIADQASFDVGLRTHMVRVYNYMASGLALSGIVAFALFNFERLQNIFFQMGRTRRGDRPSASTFWAGSRSSRRSACCC